MKLPSETLNDVLPLFTRFELDDFKFVSRKFRRLIDASVPLFSFRLFPNVDIREQEVDFSIDTPKVQFRLIEHPNREVGEDLSAPHRIEGNVETAVGYLQHAFVKRMAINGMPNMRMCEALRDQKPAFTVDIFVLDGANLLSLESHDLIGIIVSIPGIRQLTVCDSQMTPDQFSDDLMRACTLHGISSVRSMQDEHEAPHLTDTGVLDFYALASRQGRNDACAMDVRVRGSYTDGLLLKFVEAMEAGQLVGTFCVTLCNVPDQRLDEYRHHVRPMNVAFIQWMLRIKELQLLVYYGRRMLFVSRNHLEAGCSCPIRMIRGRYAELNE